MNARARLAAAVAQVRDGASMLVVCARMGMTRDVLRKACVAAGVIEPGRVSPWTPERIATLRKYWRSESTRQIAARLDCTRNAVIGKAHRLGLPEKPNGSPVRK